MTMKYFLYGHGPRCVKNIMRGISIKHIEFDYIYNGVGWFDGRTVNSVFLFHHFLYNTVEFGGVGSGNVIRIYID